LSYYRSINSIVPSQVGAAVIPEAKIYTNIVQTGGITHTGACTLYTLGTVPLIGYTPQSYTLSNTSLYTSQATGATVFTFLRNTRVYVAVSAVATIAVLALNQVKAVVADCE
jgi:hypothetical protein